MISHASQRGLSLVELLVVIAIIAILLQLTLAAVEHSRESARRTACQHNLRQIGLASLQHEQAHGHYPTGGWGWNWVGDPDRGYGAKQPGSWAFNVLPYLEEGEVRAMGSGLSGTARSEAIVERCAVPLPIFACPSRRLPRAWPLADPRSTLTTNDGAALPITNVARSDYAINTGDLGKGEPGGKIPKTLAEGDNPDFEWYDTSEFTGISYGRSTVRVAEVTDGSSETYFAAEKFLPTNHYKTGLHYGDNECIYSGFDNDNGRSTEWEPWRDSEKFKDIGRERFGSPHPSGWQAVYCDGSVRPMAYDIELDVHKRLGNRADGKSVTLEGG